LLVLPSGTSIASLELAIIDLIDSDQDADERERSMLGDLRDLIRKVRVRDAVSKAEMLFIDTETLSADDETRTAPAIRRTFACIAPLPVAVCSAPVFPEVLAFLV
jgi:hypothetical protein